MENEELYHLILKYIKGDASVAETEVFFNWLDQSSENKILYFKIKDLVNRFEHPEEQFEASEKIWDTIRSKSQKQNKPKLTGSNLKGLAIAASIILVVAAILIYKASSPASQMIEYRLGINEPVKKIELPDHSIVWLKPGSSLKYPGDFKKREVSLQGDGFFEVAKSFDELGQRRPFEIEAGQIRIAVKGTSFNVKSTPATSNVTVNTGVVQVEAQNQKAVLHPGQFASLNDNQLKTGKINPSLFNSWITGHYSFDNTPFSEIVQLLELSNAASVEVKEASRLQMLHVTGHITAETNQQLYHILETMLSVTIRQKGDLITIAPL